MKSKLFYIFIGIAVITLIVFSLGSVERTDAIIAQVESQKTAISFRKPILVKAIYVSAGQHVKKGQLLIEVDRPDLTMEQTKLTNDKQLILAEKNKLLSDLRSKINLLAIEMSSKIQRLEANINQLETEIRLNQALYADVIAMTETNSSSKSNLQEDPDQILLESYKKEIVLLQRYHTSEKMRLKQLTDQDLQALELQLNLIAEELQALDLEQSTLKQFAPFDGAIGNVNIQLMELVPPFQTIITVYEERPSSIKAFVNLSTGIELAVGQLVTVESANRAYFTSGEVLEIGARIVAYQDPAKPISPVQLFGKEVFIKLPEENGFLYGEQVYVFVTTE